MKRSNRTMLVIAVVVMLVGWLAWKMLFTAALFPSPPSPPAAQDAAR